MWQKLNSKVKLRIECLKNLEVTFLRKRECSIKTKIYHILSLDMYPQSKQHSVFEKIMELNLNLRTKTLVVQFIKMYIEMVVLVK